MADKKRLFGTFGVRRTANDVLTPEFASRLAACYGSQIQGTVAVGGDTRTSTPMLKEAVKAGLLSSGCDVVDLGILPTPGVQYAVRKYYDGGVMITASHNPPKYNGLKFLDEYGIGIPDEMDLAIEKLDALQHRTLLGNLAVTLQPSTVRLTDSSLDVTLNLSKKTCRNSSALLRNWMQILVLHTMVMLTEPSALTRKETSF